MRNALTLSHRLRTSLCSAICLLLIAALPSQSLLACAECGDVKIGYQGNGCVHGKYSLVFSGPVEGEGNEINDTISASGIHCAYASTSRSESELTLDAVYEVKLVVDATSDTSADEPAKVCTNHLSFEVPSCYKLEVMGDGYESWTVTDAIDRSDVSPQATGIPNNTTWKIRLRKADDSDTAAGDGNTEVNSVHLRIGLGKANGWRSAGVLAIKDEEITSSTYTPVRLQTLGLASDVERIPATGPVQQVRTGDALADVVVTGTSSYEVRFYHRDQVQAFSTVTNRYPVSGSPFVTWKIENPSTTGGVDQLKITETRSGRADTVLYTRNLAESKWTLDRNNGARTEVVQDTYPPGQRTRTTTVTHDGVTVSKAARTYETFAFGEKLIRLVDGVTGTTKETNYSYYTDAAVPASYRKLKAVTYADGSWEKYEYTSDPVLKKSTKKVYRPWLDMAASPDTASDANSTATLTDYTGGMLNSTVKSYVLGQKVSEISESGVTGLDRSYTRSDSAVSYSKGYTSGVDGPANGRISTTQRILGNDESTRSTIESYTYEAGNYDAVSGNFTTDSAGKAMLMVAIRSKVAENKSTRETTITDERGRIVLEQTDVITDIGGNGTPLAWEAVAKKIHTYIVDATGLLTKTTKDGLTQRVLREEKWRGGLKQSEVDETGVETIYTYNARKELATETRKGVAVSGTYPAQVDIVTTYGRSGLTETTTRTAGALTLTSSVTRDVLGRLVSQTDENGLTNQWNYSADGLITTMTRPDGSTEITAKYRDGRTKSVTGTGVVNRAYTYEKDPTTGNEIVTEYLGAAGTSSPRWTKTETNSVGQTVKTTRPAFNGATIASQQFYDSYNRLSYITNPGFANTRFEYDALDQPFRTGLDVDNSATLVPASNDRIKETEEGYLSENGNWYRFRRTQSYYQDGNGTPTVLDETRWQMTGLAASEISRTITIDARGNRTTRVLTVDRTQKIVTETVDVPNSTQDIVRVTRNGLLQTDRSATIANPTRYACDALGRIVTVTDPRGAVTTTVYVPGKNQVQSVADHLNQTTSYTYYGQGEQGAGQIKTQSNPDTTVRRFAYTARGELYRQWGSAGYPVEYGYDGYGDRNTMRTFRAEVGWNSTTWPAAGLGDLTTWDFQPSTGLLRGKVDALFRSVSFQYYDTVDNRLKLRTSANPGVTTTYTYSTSTGELTTVDYSDATPDVTLTYDRQGRVSTANDGAGYRTLTYDAFGNALDELNTSGLLGGLSVNRIRDPLGRLRIVRSKVGESTAAEYGYSYESSTGRLEDVISGDRVAHYTYEPQADWVKSVSFRRANTERLLGTRIYDTLGRLSSIVYTGTQNIVLSSSETTEFDSMNRRKKRRLQDQTSWSYGYNDRGEVTFGSKLLSDGSYLSGWQFGYYYDAIGNRLGATVGGDAIGANRRSAVYTPNELNQYSSREVPGYVNILGNSTSDASVTVNGFVVDRQGEWWRKELPVSNGSNLAVTQVAVQGARGTQTATNPAGKLYTPKTPENFVYDNEGNLKEDGRWSYVYDAENRLISVETSNTAAAAGAPRIKRDYRYDFLGRRVAKIQYTWVQPPAPAAPYYQQSVTEKFLYDGWSLIATHSSAVNGIVASYIWGLDRSNSLNGAGAIGGLIFVDAYQSSVPNRKTHAVACDESGNVVALVDTGSGAVSARYEYSPYGEPLRMTGPMALINIFRFSTHVADDETGLIYAKCRYYNPAIGRWMSRDPFQEQGGANLYGYVSNQPVNLVDPFGLWRYAEDAGKRKQNMRATVVAEAGDTIRKLAAFLKLDPTEYERWLGESDRGIDDSWSAGCTASVPNTMVFLEGSLSTKWWDPTQLLVPIPEKTPSGGWKLGGGLPGLWYNLKFCNMMAKFRARVEAKGYYFTYNYASTLLAGGEYNTLGFGYFGHGAAGLLTTEYNTYFGPPDVRFEFKPAMLYLYACQAGQLVGPRVGPTPNPTRYRSWNALVSDYGTVYAESVDVIGFDPNLTPHPPMYDDDPSDNFEF